MNIIIHHGLTTGMSSLFLKTLSSRGVYIRPLVMVAHPFVPECITPKCLAHGNKGEPTPTTTVGILCPLIYIWWNSPSLIPLWHLRPSVMVAPPFVPECITPNCLAHGNEGEATPTTTVGIPHPLIYDGDSPSLIPLWHLRPSVMVVLFFLPVHYQKVYHEKEEEERPPRQQSAFFFIHIWWTLPHCFLTVIYGAPTDLKSTQNVV